LDFRSSELLLVGAHCNTAAGTPGADDNASGVAVLLELARLLREISLQVTLRWVAFTLEEPPSFGTPHMGSWVHARKCRIYHPFIVSAAPQMDGLSSRGPKLASFCRETLGMAVLQAVRIYTEAPEWLSWA